MTTHPDPEPFRSRARAHMRQWVDRELSVTPTDPVSVILPPAQAAQGGNFYPEFDVRGAVAKRFPGTFRTTMGRGSRAGDALCSAHVPFNLFAPLASHVASGAAARVLTAMLGTGVQGIDGVAFEQPANRDENLLGDNTAFDAFISSATLRVGIEVKFTEGPYAWGKSERTRMFDPQSPYNVATRTGGWFRDDGAVDLRTCHLKQMWRNMLLAQTLTKRLSVPCYYVHMYPEGNVYQASVVAEFARALTKVGLERFRPLTYERYLEILSSAGCDGAWVSYLRRRYVAF